MYETNIQYFPIWLYKYGFNRFLFPFKGMILLHIINLGI